MSESLTYKEELRGYLSNKYQGPESFLKTVIFPIFGKDEFVDFYETELLENQPERKGLAEATGICSVKQIGQISIGIEPLQIFDITVNNRVIMERNRLNIQRLIRSVMESFSCAFMIFHYEDDTRWDWRFSYCHKKGNADNLTDGKRFTFLLGPGQSCRTATDNFMSIYEKHGDIEISDIEQAFNVEALSKEFFGKYKQQYERFVTYLSDPANGLRENFIATDINRAGLSADAVKDLEEKPIRDYVKKLLGRIVFLHFLQKKGWLGVPADRDWGDGDYDFMLHLYQFADERQKENFLDEVLERLFEDALDRNRTEEHDVFDTGVDRFRNVRIPYLNGGLFERDELDGMECRFPSEYFDGLLTMLSQYNFTIDENDPNDAEVGVDPEMLGRIFENLLEDNKDKGAFYTPKEIVQYMCRESLIAYLQTDYGDSDQERIRKFVLTHDAVEIQDIKDDIEEKLTRVKICDPAIGSGAFPMGLLRELFYCHCAINPESASNAADIKRHIIQKNIYGVDIDRSAVDIARLRFWLSLIVDERSPITLPNLDFKIVQGNSLLERYKGIDLSTLVSETENEPALNLLGEYENRKIDFTLTSKDSALELQGFLSKYYDVDDCEQKSDLRNRIQDNIRGQIIYNINIRIQQAESIIEDLSADDENRLNKRQKAELKSQTAKRDHYKTVLDEIKNLDMINDRFFLWHTWFSEVLTLDKQSGFDIVIGNPPYIQLQNNGGALADLYEQINYDTFTRTGDIYCLFYELGYQLLTPHGYLCYITSNKWMRAGYGQNMREFFYKKTNPKILIDFAGVKIFESATVDTNIMLYSKEKYQHKTWCVIADRQSKGSIKNLGDFVQHGTTYDFKNSEPWIVLSNVEQNIKNKIESVGIPLKDWDINIYRGVLTGCNEAFIITTRKRNEILSNCRTDNERKRTEELIRPILRGRNIKKYGYNWDNLWLINAHNGIGEIPYVHIEDYPSVKFWLDNGGIAYNGKIFKGYTQIEKRFDQGATPYNLRSCEYLEDFSKPKILWKRIGSILRFCYDDIGIYGLDSTCFLTGENIAYLCCVLNSPMGHYLLKDAPKTGTGDLLVSVQAIEPIMIPKISYEQNLCFERALNELIKTNSPDTEKRISDMIFDLFCISEDERRYIINNFS